MKFLKASNDGSATKAGKKSSIALEVYLLPHGLIAFTTVQWNFKRRDHKREIDVIFVRNPEVFDFLLAFHPLL